MAHSLYWMLEVLMKVYSFVILHMKINTSYTSFALKSHFQIYSIFFNLPFVTANLPCIILNFDLLLIVMSEKTFLRQVRFPGGGEMHLCIPSVLPKFQIACVYPDV